MTAESRAAPRIVAAPVRVAAIGALIAPNLRRLRPVILPVATAAAVLAVWQVIVAALHIPAVILPTPVEIGGELVRGLAVLLAALGAASFSQTGNGNNLGQGINYNSCFVQGAIGPITYKILSFREIKLTN